VWPNMDRLEPKTPSILVPLPPPPLFMNPSFFSTPAFIPYIQFKVSRFGSWIFVSSQPIFKLHSIKESRFWILIFLCLSNSCFFFPIQSKALELLSHVS
jgi:hypothetical protein